MDAEEREWERLISGVMADAERDEAARMTRMRRETDEAAASIQRAAVARAWRADEAARLATARDGANAAHTRAARRRRALDADDTHGCGQGCDAGLGQVCNTCELKLMGLCDSCWQQGGAVGWCTACERRRLSGGVVM